MSEGGEEDGTSEAPGATLGEDWRIIESLLPAGWMEMARELGAFRRARGFADARALLRVMLIHLADGCGLRETAVRAALAGLADVTDVALLKRLKSCERWFEWMAQQLREPLPRRERDASEAARAAMARRSSGSRCKRATSSSLIAATPMRAVSPT